MKWNKKGLIYVPDGSLEWSKSHAQVPVPLHKREMGIVRVFFSTRDEKGRSLPGYVDLNDENLFEVVSIAQQPVLTLGEIGTFDDCGVMPSWITLNNDKLFMYYIGWNVRNTIPYHNSVGLAVSEDYGNTFKKFSNGPLWDRDYREPHYSGTTCVIKEENGLWRNWYLSCTEWRVVNGRVEPRYHIKYAESLDGITWNRKGTIAIDYKDKNEAGIVKASVIKEGNIYKMWYSYRNFTNYRIDIKNSYKIGYAESIDGIQWRRMDNQINLSLSENGWDSKMIEYPHVININGKLHMFYNGNGFGESGFGYATLD